MTIKQLAIITYGFPTELNPGHGSFVHELVVAFSKQGVKCTAVHPIRIFDLWRGLRIPYQDEIPVDGGNSITVFSPPYLPFSDRKFFRMNTGLLTQYFFESSVNRVFNKNNIKPNAIYGHFLRFGGTTAARIGKQRGIPSFVAVGEGRFSAVKLFGSARAQSYYASVAGVISVSGLIKKKIMAEIKIPEEKIEIFPNGVDLSIMKPLNQNEVRQKLGLPLEKFLVIFVGAFNDNKGVLRVVEALDGMQDIGLVLIGTGDLNPTGSNILFKGQVDHSRIPEYLSAGDVFVLPTTYEGSCNVLLEAMACGLPLVTSTGEFNDDIVNEHVAIRIDPLDVAAIREAVLLLKDNQELRDQMASEALKRGKEFDINQRARKILAWMEKKVA